MAKPKQVRCKHCGKVVVQDTAGRGWRHGPTGPYECFPGAYATPSNGRKAKEKFDIKKTGDLLVAKYVTTRTDGNRTWFTLYQFVHHCMSLAYKAGKTDAKT